MFVLLRNENKVYKLIKSLYRLKIAPKQWHENFDSTMLPNGFKHNGTNKCIYSKFTKECGIIICLYVDDMIIFNMIMMCINETKRYLMSIFKTKI